MKSGQGGIPVQNSDWLEYENFLKWKKMKEQTVSETLQRLM